MSTTATRTRQRGQILPMGLALLVCGVLLLGLCFRLGARLLQAERLAMRTDLTAYSGGIQVARCLNILSYSEKLRMAGEIVGYIPTPWTKALGSGVEKLMNAFQKFFIPVAPWVVEADVVGIGLANELGALPLWNQADALGGFDVQRLRPDLRVKANNDDGKEQDSQNKDGQDSGTSFPGLDDSSQSSYHYQSKNGERHDLDQDQAGAVTENGPHGTEVTRYKDKSSHKYVARDKGGQKKSHGMTDQGPHYLAVFSVQTADDRQAWTRPALALGCAQVRIAGGDVNAFDLQHGADYAPYFVPMRDRSDDDGSVSGTNLSQILRLATQSGLLSGGLARGAEAMATALEVQH